MNGKNYIESAILQFRYYKMLGEKAMSQVVEADLFKQYSEVSNSIAIIVKHLHGNMLSRWSDFLISDGEKSWRDRDGEFVQTYESREEMMEKWEQGWRVLFQALSSVSESNIDQVIYIRNQGHTITEAINRQLGHYSYHVGQIVYLARMMKGDQWKSLSVPKGESTSINLSSFSKGKRNEHFTQQFLDDDDNANIE